MGTDKVYAVVLFDWAAQELGKLVELWLRRSEMGCYVYAKEVDPNGTYLHMLIEDQGPDRMTREVELQIPHQFVKAIFNTADVTRIGFT